MMRSIVLRAWVLLALAFGGAGGAAAQNFEFSYQVGGLNVAGTFVTTAQGNGRFLISSILDGFRGGNAITLLAPGTDLGGSPNDNILINPSNPFYVTNSGVGYSSQGVNYAFFVGSNVESGASEYAEYNDSTGTDSPASNVQVAPAPHPGGGGLSFLALGLFGLFHCRRVIRARFRWTAPVAVAA